MELHQVSHQNLLSEIKASPLANKPAGRFHFSPGFARLLKTSGNFDMNAKKNATQFSCLPQNELNEGQDKQTSTVSARSTCTTTTAHMGTRGPGARRGCKVHEELDMWRMSYVCCSLSMSKRGWSSRSANMVSMLAAEQSSPDAIFAGSSDCIPSHSRICSKLMEKVINFIRMVLL